LKVKVKLEKRQKGLSFQDLILQLSQFWVKQGCVLQQPYDVEVGAGTMHRRPSSAYLGQVLSRWLCATDVVGPPTVATVKTRTAFTSIHNFKSSSNLRPLMSRTSTSRVLAPIGIHLKNMTSASKRTTGNPRRSRLGHRLASASRRPRDHAVHLLPAERRIDLDPISVELTTASSASAPSSRASRAFTISAGPADKTYGDIRLMEEQQLSEYSFDRSDAAAIRAEFELHEKPSQGTSGTVSKSRKGRTASAGHCSRRTTTASSVRTSST